MSIAFKTFANFGPMSIRRSSNYVVNPFRTKIGLTLYFRDVAYVTTDMGEI